LVGAAGSFGLLSPAAIPSPFTPVDRT